MRIGLGLIENRFELLGQNSVNVPPYSRLRVLCGAGPGLHAGRPDRAVLGTVLYLNLRITVFGTADFDSI